MTYSYNVDVIVNYLNRYKSNLSNMYVWKFKIDKLLNHLT